MIHTGILAHSPDGSALCYLTFCHLGYERFGAHDHADLTLDYVPMGRSIAAWDTGDHAAIRQTFAVSIARLKAAGAQFFICPDNTAHIALETPGPDFALPGLNIAEVVADRAAEEGYSRVGILGTAYTMEGPVYPRALGARGIDHVVPEPAEREVINRVIFEELCVGIVTDSSRAVYLNIIERLKAQGCDAVALVCTEIPLLITPEISPLPTLNSTHLLATAGFAVSLGERAMPTWRGGPVTEG
ncbi:aspartate/glutamate racemase family protein [Sphingomonas cavernae]|uniref:Amino acid racemase n=1 Tax=Sphingomonas cavernae TaxID=2320861 RepID=A0A418WNG7_9SPHN|nr:amino acid racemase [Sphingomonas cavernae]RJF91540.1 amino acid racemase [Sphingomonas cavernae]